MTTWGDEVWGTFLWGEWVAVPPDPEAPPSDLTLAVTPEQVLALISASALTVSFGAELLDANDVLEEDISADLLSGEVERNNYADVHGTCTLRLSRELDWATARVRPYQTLTGGGYTQTWYLGVYLLTTPQTPLGESPATYDVAGYDKLHLLQMPIGDTYVVTAGTGYLAAVQAAITASGVTGLTPFLEGTAQATVLASPMVWVLDPEDPSTYLRVCNNLLAAVGYRGLWVDSSGRFRSEPYQSPVVRAPVWTFDIGDQHTCIVSENRTLTSDIYEPTNWWRFIRNGMTWRPVEGDGLYTVDQSGGGTKYKAVYALDAASQAALVSRGDAIVQSQLQIEQTIDVATGPLPILGHFDVFNYRDLDAGLDAKCQARSHRIPLNGDDVELVLEVL